MNIANSGIVAVIGRPNAGKSTLINKIMGEKVAIVSPKPQTTRRKLCAVYNSGATQMVFIDTPGFHKPRTKLGQYMVREIRESADDVDAVVLVVEPVPSAGDIERELLTWRRNSNIPVFLCINKIDTLPREKLLAVIAAYQNEYNFSAILPICAKNGDGVDGLIELLTPLMPQGEALYPEGMATDQPERVMISEVIREKLLNRLNDEVPHGTAVIIDVLKERENGLIDIEATITCERDSHKGIIIGKNGSKLKEIGSLARAELEEMYEGSVNLQLWVRVRGNWRDNDTQLRNLGFE